MKIDIPPPTVVRRTAAKAKTQIGDGSKPPTIVRRIAPVRIQRLRKA
jgi:hypothetical protein